MTDAFLSFEDARRWVVWRPEERNGGQVTKVPCNADGTPVDITNPTNWLTRLEAEGGIRELVANDVAAGLGIVLGDLGDDQHLCGADLDSSLSRDGIPFMLTLPMREQLLGLGYTGDDIRNLTPQQANEILAPNGHLADWAQKILDVLRTYAEISPSGHGLKAFFYVAAHMVRDFLDRIGVPAGSWGTKRGIPGLSSANHGPAIEVYCAHRFFTVTGRLWSPAQQRIALVTSVQLAELAKLIPKRSTPGRPGGGPGSPSGELDNSRSGKAWRAALALHAGSFEEMCDGLHNHADPEIREWANEVDDRQLQRLWDRGAGKVVEREAALAERLSDWERQHPFPDPDEGEPSPSPEPPSILAPDTGAGVNLRDFYAYMPQHNYLFAPSREPWPAISVDARIPPVAVLDPEGNPLLHKKGKHKDEPVEIAASEWLDKHQPVEQLIWAPGEDMVIRGRLVSEGGWVKRRRVSVFNLYLPPQLPHGDPEKADPWVEHGKKIYPEEHEHIFRWLAHRVQHPAAKINHALVLGGEQGIGKDTLLEPVKRTIGPWNFREASPSQVMGRFNGFLKAVILRISEARDLGETDRYKFYDHMKAYTAAPPDVLRCDEKNLREHAIINCCGVIYTTNYKAEGLYLPADDRRHYVAWSHFKKEDFAADYWGELWRFYDNGGDRHVAAYLAQLDLSDFNPKAPPPQTTAFWEVVNTNRTTEDIELADVLDAMGNPEAITLLNVALKAGELGLHDLDTWLRERKHRRILPGRFATHGYVPVRNPYADDGLWRITDRRQVIYARLDLPPTKRQDAAKALT
jgi:hypothetical protein